MYSVEQKTGGGSGVDWIAVFIYKKGCYREQLIALSSN